VTCRMMSWGASSLASVGPDSSWWRVELSPVRDVLITASDGQAGAVDRECIMSVRLDQSLNAHLVSVLETHGKGQV